MGLHIFRTGEPVHEPKPQPLVEVPGGDRRADAFLLVMSTLVAPAMVAFYRRESPLGMPLLGAGLWLLGFGRWLRHVRPRYARAVRYLGLLAWGVALYAGLMRR